jgi:ribose transport system ATP-binding protein
VGPDILISSEKDTSLKRSGDPIIRVSDVSKSFGGVQALKQVSIDIYPGEVHGLIGANGAGKSTLIKILSGDIKQDSGTIYLDNQPLHIDNPQDAYNLGFSFIHQELSLVPKFSIIENLTLGMPKAKRLGLIDWKTVRREARAVTEKIGLNHSMDTPVSNLSVADQWLVSIAHSLMRKIRVISMDEPTASLSEEESGKLFKVVQDLVADGVSVLYVSHRLDEILTLCDGISVLKDGVCVLSTEKERTNKQELVEAIVGGKISGSVVPVDMDFSDKPLVFETRSLTRSPKVLDVSMKVHAGEVVGLAGLVGSGRTELANLIFGVDKPDSGQMFLESNPIAPKNPTSAIQSGIGLVPEERRSQGLILKDSIDFNINLASLKKLRLNRFLPFLSRKKSASVSRSIVDRLRIKAPSIHTSVLELSGGNQQKVVIGKWLTKELKVLILDEPSRGVDVGARGEIHNKIRELAESGAGIIVISSDNEELPYICNTVYVMAEGRIAGVLKGSEITQEAISYKSYEHFIEDKGSTK